MDNVQLKVVNRDECLRLFGGLIFSLLCSNACIAHALHLSSFGLVHNLKFHNFMEVAVDGKIGNFVSHTLSETRITHPHTIRRNIQLLRTLYDGLRVETVDSFRAVGSVVINHVSVAFFPSQKTRGLRGFGSADLREKFRDGVRKVVVKLGNLKACLLGLRKRTINLCSHNVQKYNYIGLVTPLHYYPTRLN